MNPATGRLGASVLAAILFIAVLALPALTTGCANGGWSAARNNSDSMEIPPLAVPRSRTPGDPIPATFLVPSGKGPFPAVIVLHGCGGLGPSQVIWARRLNGWGYAALIPDSLTPRGVTRVCEPEMQRLVTPRDRVGDILSSAEWLRTQPKIDPTRIAVLGLSHGGAAAVLATQRIYQQYGLRAAVDYYGPCVEPEAHGTVPLLVLVGGADDWGHPAVRCEAYGKAADVGEKFEIHVYPGVYHAFDNPNMTLAVSNNHTMEYNQAAAEDSFVRVRDFLDRWVRH